MRYAIVIEKVEGNYPAYALDLPGRAARGATVAEIEAEIREAIILHVEGLREDGMPVPVAAGQVNYLDIAARPVPVHDSGNAQHPAPGDTASQRGRARALVTEE